MDDSSCYMCGATIAKGKKELHDRWHVELPTKVAVAALEELKARGSL